MRWGVGGELVRGGIILLSALWWIGWDPPWESNFCRTAALMKVKVINLDSKLRKLLQTLRFGGIKIVKSSRHISNPPLESF